MPIKKILVALDCSSNGPIVFEQALDQAIAHHASIVLVHTLRPEPEMPTGPFMGIGTIADVDMYGTLKRLQQERIDQEIEKAKIWLNDYREKAIARGIATDVDCRVGEPSVLICELARSWGVDLIMIGRRGHQGLAEVVLGSVSNYVVHHSPCSVLVVQGNAPLDTIEANSAELTRAR